MTAWLMKSEPSSYAWQQLVKDKTTRWDGVKNPQAIGFLKQMKNGDVAYFYETGDVKAVVGCMVIVSPAAQNDAGWFVEVKVDRALKQPVTLAALKKQSALADHPLVKQPRLSVMPVGVLQPFLEE